MSLRQIIALHFIKNGRYCLFRGIVAQHRKKDFSMYVRYAMCMCIEIVEILIDQKIKSRKILAKLKNICHILEYIRFMNRRPYNVNDYSYLYQNINRIFEDESSSPEYFSEALLLLFKFYASTNYNLYDSLYNIVHRNYEYVLLFIVLQQSSSG